MTTPTYTPRPGESVCLSSGRWAHVVIEVLDHGKAALATKCHRRVDNATPVELDNVYTPPLCPVCANDPTPSRLRQRRPIKTWTNA